MSDHALPRNASPKTAVEPEEASRIYRGPHSATVFATIDGFPRAQQAVLWDAQHIEFVRDAVRAVDPKTPKTAYKLLTALAGFTTWALEQDLPLAPDRVLTPDRVDEYLSTGRRRDLAPGTRATLRTQLRHVARATTRTAPWPAETNFAYLRPNRFLPPYTPAQIEHYWDAASLQPTVRLRQYMTCLLVFAHGAGLRSIEIRALTAADIIPGTSEEVGWLVHARPRGTDRGRTVPILRRYDRAVAQLRVDRPTGALAGRYDDDPDDPLAKIRGQLRLPTSLPPLDPRRLRNTWLCEHLDRGVALLPLLQAAGVKSLRVSEMMPYLREVNATARLAGN